MAGVPPITLPPPNAGAAQNPPASITLQPHVPQTSSSAVAAGPEPQTRGSQVQTRPGPADIYRQLGSLNLHRAAFERGMGLSAYLERIDPSSQYRDGSDAFQRQLMAAGIRVASDVDAGFVADTWEDFCKDENSRALAYEWAIRTAKRAAGRSPQTRALYTSADQPVGSVIEPWVSAAQARFQQLAPAIPLAELVSITTPIQGDAYRAFYLTTTTSTLRFNRVAQGAEVPRAKLAGSDHTIRLHKYGKALDVTYEIMRRQRIDLIGLHIARMQIQTEIDRVAAAMDVIVNGDGNANTAATNYNLTSLDGTATADNPTIKAWIAFRTKFVNPYALTTVLTQSTGAAELLLLNMTSAGWPLSVVNQTAGFGGLQLIQPQLQGGIRLGITSDAPSEVVIGFDSRFGLEHVTEIGADITELERFVLRQTQAIVITYVDGWSVLDPNSLKTLTLNA